MLTEFSNNVRTIKCNSIFSLNFFWIAVPQLTAFTAAFVSLTCDARAAASCIMGFELCEHAIWRKSMIVASTSKHIKRCTANFLTTYASLLGRSTAIFSRFSSPFSPPNVAPVSLYPTLRFKVGNTDDSDDLDFSTLPNINNVTLSFVHLIVHLFSIFWFTGMALIVLQCMYNVRAWSLASWISCADSFFDSFFCSLLCSEVCPSNCLLFQPPWLMLEFFFWGLDCCLSFIWLRILIYWRLNFRHAADCAAVAAAVYVWLIEISCAESPLIASLNHFLVIFLVPKCVHLLNF